jgi:outer membrane protein assembly factor BamB
MANGRLAMVMSFVIFCAAASGATTKTVTTRQLVSRELLKPAELEIVWETKLPIKKGETLEQLFILGNRIYGLSSENYLVSINRSKGNFIFSRSIAEKGLPVEGLGLYKDGLFSVAGNKLVEISPETGMERSGARGLEYGVTCPVVRNEPFFYIAGTDMRMHALRSGDKVQVFEVAAKSDSRITSVVADENSVIFSTEAGEVISIEAEKSKKLWQFNAGGGIAGPIVRDGAALFVASRDTDVYRLNAENGKLVWKYQAGAMLEKGPRVTKTTVYQYARGEGLSAINKENGKLLWQMADGEDLLAEADGKAYVITKTGNLAVMDNKKAKQLYSVDATTVSRYASNTTDSRIYIADMNGRIACLQPIKY